MRDSRAQQSARDCGNVGVDNDGICPQTLAVGEKDANGPVAFHVDLRDCHAETKRRAERRCHAKQCLGQPVHAAFNCPDAFLLDVRDQHECCRRLERRGPAIRCIAAEQLAQSRILEVFAQRAHECCEWRDPPQRRESGKSGAAGKSQRTPARRAQEWSLKCRVDFAGADAECEKTACFGRSGEIADRLR